MAECLNDEQLENLAAGSLPPEAAEPLQAHVTTCQVCRVALAEWRAVVDFAPTVKTALGDATTMLLEPNGSSSGIRDLERPESVPGYELQEVLRRGAQGIVYRAVHTDSRRVVAIKFLNSAGHANESTRRRFEREIELARSLHHPGIIRVWDSGTSLCGRDFYVMDYVDGLPLNEFVRQRKLDLTQTLQLFVSLCDAVNYAHQHGVIHRDLKPSNILVDTQGSPRVLDFGLAKLLPGSPDTALSLAGQIMGTLPYMSPEQVRGRSDRIDIRTDVYALGIVLYVILTGSFPYPVSGPVPEILRNISEAPPDRPCRRWSKELGIRPNAQAENGQGKVCPIDEEIETILMRALAKQPENRYPNVAALMEDVSRRLSGQPIEARREARLSVLTRTIARYRAAALLACFALLLITTFTIALGWLYQEARIQREQAAADRAQALRSQTLLADALVQLGDRELEAGNDENALGQYLAGLAIQEHLAVAYMDNLVYQENLAANLLRLGDIYAHRGDKTHALPYYDRYHHLMQQLAETEPQNADYQAGLLEAQTRLEAIKPDASSQPATVPTGPGGSP